MSTMKFYGTDHMVELFSAGGKSIGKWMAYNNIDSGYARKHYGGQLHLTNGTYTFLDTTAPHTHLDDAPSSSFGLYGILRFNYPKHPGVGVHSGRAHEKVAPGPLHATHGFIRTTDAAMAAIKAHIATDKLTTIEITGNDKVKAHHGKAKLHKIVYPGEDISNLLHHNYLPV